MTQPIEAVGSDEPIVAVEPTVEDRLSAALGTEDETEEESPPVEEEAPQEAEPDEGEDEIELEAEDTDLPPIDAPVSWSAEEKGEFAELPRNIQETLTKREAQREKFVQSKAQEAATSREAARTEALQFASQLKAETVEHLQRYAQQFEINPPDARLYAADPQAYAQQLETYQYAQAQRLQAQRDADTAKAEQAQYQSELQQHEAQAFRQQLEAEIPEAFDPANGQKFIEGLAATAKALAYDENAISQASVEELKALKLVTDWKAKAERFDKAMVKQMERVRAGKGKLPPVSKPGVSQAPGAKAGSQYQKDREAMKRGDKDAELRVLSRFINS